MEILKTRIKVITKGDEINYIAQKKGIRKLSSQYKYLIYFMYLLLFPITIIIFLIESIFWEEIDDYEFYIKEVDGLKKYSLEYSKKQIDYVLEEEKRVILPKPKKTITYIKYP